MMAENEEKALKFIWKIENYSYCWKETGDFIPSPDFEMDVFEGSSWCLKLYPRGVTSYENYISVHLMRLPSSKGPHGINIDYEIAVLRPDGTVEYVKEKKNQCFRKGYTFGFDNLAARNEVLGTKRPILLPKDILTVQCRMFPRETLLKSHTEMNAKTHLEVERYIFRWESKNCFSKRLNELYTLKFLNGRQSLGLKLYWDSVEQLEYLKIYFYNYSDLKVFCCKLCILDCNNLISLCVLDKHVENGKDNFLFIATNEIMKQKTLFLPNDKLTLHCDFTFSFRIQYSQIETVALGRTFYSVFENREVPSETNKHVENHSSSCTDIYASFKNDFQTLYKEGTLFDFTLKVGNENIRAHKAVLVARSPVFKAMLTSNMKESEKNSVDILDLDANTVRCMLRFLYTDVTGDLDWEEARKLYFAADKYGVTKLKGICSDVLKRNLCVSSVAATLALANLHGDEGLKDLTIEFISKHDTEVMCSTEWKEFMDEDAHLAAETMRQIFMKKAESERKKL